MNAKKKNIYIYIYMYIYIYFDVLNIYFIKIIKYNVIIIIINKDK